MKQKPTDRLGWKLVKLSAFHQRLRPKGLLFQGGWFSWRKVSAQVRLAALIRQVNYARGVEKLERAGRTLSSLSAQQQQQKRIFLHFAVASPPARLKFYMYFIFPRLTMMQLSLRQPRPRLPPKKERAPRHQHKYVLLSNLPLCAALA